MRSSLRTIILTVLATLIAVHVVGLWFSPEHANAQAGFSGVQFTRSDGGLYFFDTRSGELWIYDEGRKLPLWHFRMAKLGAPLEKISLTGKRAEPATGAPAAQARDTRR